MKPTTSTQAEPTRGTHAQFHETRWTVVIAAADPLSPGVSDALTQLCRTYWYPLYAFARRNGVSPHDAADVTQSFFVHLFEKAALEKVDRAKGKFRSFLLASLKNFLHNHWDKEKAQKRGGKCEIVSLDEMAAERRYQEDPVDQSSAEQLYDVQWAVSLVRAVLEQLRAQYAQAGKAELFAALEPCLTGDVPDGRLAEIGAKLAVNPNTLKATLHRLRRDEFGPLLRQQVRHTLANPTEQDVRDEIRHLFASIATK